MKINGADRCIGCMKLLDQDGSCPYCHFPQKEYHPIPRCLRPGTCLEKRYILGKVLGEGSFGISYIAWDSLLEVAVAIKEYFPANLVSRHVVDQEDTNVYVYEKHENQKYRENLKKYLNEAKNLSAFSDLDGIVSVKDFFYANNTAYIVMAYVDGISVKEYVENNGRIPGSQLMEMMKPVLKALGKVHSTGMLHRDISPDNILITKDQKLVLIDFGAARKENISKTRSMTVVFKRGYSPEEQYRSRGKQGAWTDIYALCATIYYALVGEVPDESIDRLLEDETPSLTKMADIELSDAQKRAIMKGIAVKPQERYQNVENLYHALYEKGKGSWWKLKSKIAVGVIVALVVLGSVGIGALKAGTRGAQMLGQDSRTAAGQTGTGAVEEISTQTTVPKTGQETREMESFLNLTREKAQEIIQQEEEVLPVVRWKQKYSDTVKKGKIMHQNIAPGTVYTTEEYSELVLTVSKGKEKVTVPDVTGFIKEDAISRLRKKGLKWKVQTRDSETAKGTVLEQGKKKGEKVTKGTVILLTVSNGVSQIAPAAQTAPPQSTTNSAQKKTTDKTGQGGDDFDGIIP